MTRNMNDIKKTKTNNSTEKKKKIGKQLKHSSHTKTQADWMFLSDNLLRMKSFDLTL